jgi:hypothetical protein
MDDKVASKEVETAPAGAPKDAPPASAPAAEKEDSGAVATTKIVGKTLIAGSVAAVTGGDVVDGSEEALQGEVEDMVSGSTIKRASAKVIGKAVLSGVIAEATGGDFAEATGDKLQGEVEAKLTQKDDGKASTAALVGGAVLAGGITLMIGGDFAGAAKEQFQQDAMKDLEARKKEDEKVAWKMMHDKEASTGKRAYACCSWSCSKLYKVFECCHKLSSPGSTL